MLEDYRAERVKFHPYSRECFRLIDVRLSPPYPVASSGSRFARLCRPRPAAAASAILACLTTDYMLRLGFATAALPDYRSGSY